MSTLSRGPTPQPLHDASIGGGRIIPGDHGRHPGEPTPVGLTDSGFLFRSDWKSNGGLMGAPLYYTNADSPLS
jgi:hypothetical protein